MLLLYYFWHVQISTGICASPTSLNLKPRVVHLLANTLQFALLTLTRQAVLPDGVWRAVCGNGIADHISRVTGHFGHVNQWNPDKQKEYGERGQYIQRLRARSYRIDQQLCPFQFLLFHVRNIDIIKIKPNKRDTCSTKLLCKIHTPIPVCESAKIVNIIKRS